MIYSLLILTFGIFLGQEYDLPLVKNSALYIYNLIQESKKKQTPYGIIESVFSYFKMS